MLLLTPFVRKEIVERIVATCSSSKTSIHNKAFLEGPKAALIASGDYSVNGKGTKAFGRAYCAWVFSYEWFEQRKFEDEGFTSLEDFIVSFHNSFNLS